VTKRRGEIWRRGRSACLTEGYSQSSEVLSPKVKVAELWWLMAVADLF
jgi:hypothetical protein